MAPADGSGTPGEDARGWPTGSATGSRTRPCWTRPWPTARGVPSRAGRTSNERLEFLGDAVLGLVVAEYTYRNHPGALRRGDVQGPGLGGQHPGAGRGGPGAGDRPSTCAWAGARICPGAGPRSRSWPTPPRRSSAPSTSTAAWPRPNGSSCPCSRTGSPLAVGEPGESDHKSRLQELAVRLGRGVPRYEVEGSGPDHARRYLATVYVAGQRLGTGEGRSKKDAEQVAAQVACGSLEVERGGGNA